MSFSGLSSPEDLKQAWKELIYDSDLDNDSADINVIWDYQSPEQLKPGLNIINCLYNPEAPDETGHYCLIFWNSSDTSGNSDVQEEVLFYNPVMSHTADDVCVKILEDLGNEFGIDNVKVDLSGSQHLDSSNCGYHCLTRAFQLYLLNKMPGNRVIFGGRIKKGKTLEEMTTHELLESMVRLLRGIYFNSKIEVPVRKKEKKQNSTETKGSGVADTLTDEEISKPMSYTELKKKFNDYISN